MSAKRSAKPVLIGVGASAGGLEAFSELLSALPADAGLALAFVEHLDPTHQSDLADILGRKTRMPVAQVVDGMLVSADHVYVIPPNAHMRLDGDRFVLSERPSGPAPSPTVDIFMISLAEARGDRAIGVLLSGNGSDGTRGLAAIRAHGGIALVQDPAQAQNSGMPESAIAAGAVDGVMPLADIANELLRLAKRPNTGGSQPDEESSQTPELPRDEEHALQMVISRVKVATGLDLAHYKRATLLRRLDRRCAMTNAGTIAEYLKVMDADSDEIRRLLSDVLVRVTSFFRDPESFKFLARGALPGIVERCAHEGKPIRIWVPGCATGQEPYSIAMTAREYLDGVGSGLDYQIFASDLREDDLAFARRGIYPAQITDEVSPERLERFFVPVEGGFEISKTIRDTCVFARHDVTIDPPFARMDLVSCRNLLIYMDSVFQRRILGTFHYALVEGGYLLLGESEGDSAAPGLFEPTEFTSLFTRVSVVASRTYEPGRSSHLSAVRLGVQAPDAGAIPDAGESVTAQRRLDEMLLDEYAPAAVLVNDALTIMQIRGEAGEYLKIRPGAASLELPAMVSPGVVAAIRSAVAEVDESHHTAKRDVLQEKGTGHAAMSISVMPVLVSGPDMHYAVLFRDAPVVAPSSGDERDSAEIAFMRQELDAAVEELRAFRHSGDAASENLRAASEELQSSNEELRSMNEELETAKEELQSSNEELTTLNSELRIRNTELGQRIDDLSNILSSASIPMIVLDSESRVRLFTERATDVFRLMPRDVGRSFTDIRSRFAIEDLEQLLTEVLASGHVVEREVADVEGHWYRMTIQPFRTAEGSIDGTVLSLVDIDALRAGQLETERLGRFSRAANLAGLELESVTEIAPSISGAMPDVMDVLGADSYEFDEFDDGVWVRQDEFPQSEGARIRKPFSVPEAAEAGLATYSEREPVVESSAENGLERITLPLFDAKGVLIGALRLGFAKSRADLDDREREFLIRVGEMVARSLERLRQTRVLERLVKERTAALDETALRLSTALHVRDQFLARMSHELRTPLNSIIGFSKVLMDGGVGDLNEEQRLQMGMIATAGDHLLAIVLDLLDLEKIEAGAMPVSVSRFDASAAIDEILRMLAPLADAKDIELRGSIDPGIIVDSDELKLRQVVLNVLGNAIKFTAVGHVSVRARQEGPDLVIEVADTGCGMTEQQLGQAFKDFQQVDRGPTTTKDGTGLGLSIAARLSEMLGGKVSGMSTPDVGSTFTITLARHLESGTDCHDAAE